MKTRHAEKIHGQGNPLLDPLLKTGEIAPHDIAEEALIKGSREENLITVGLVGGVQQTKNVTNTAIGL